ncbi:MAG: hypothetical protein KF789_06940 [Bdellovibrionaceae bacterium]|nr:hypothetical protein [Pseudobdellovibrionaceae bacterium]
MKKKMMLIVAALMAVAPHSFAQTASLEQTYDLEEGPMSFEELAPKIDAGALQIGRSNKGDIVAGVVIGLIAGAIAAEALDSQIDARNRDYNRPGQDWNRPGRPGRPGGRPGHGGGYYPPQPPPRPQPRQVVCYAQAPYGQVFRTFGYNAQATQRQAVMKCAQFSYGCRPAGCQIVGGW